MTTLTLALSLASLFHSPAGIAGEGDLAELRQQLQSLRTAYEERIAALEARLTAAEARPAASPRPVAPVAAVASAVTPAAAASGFNPEISLTLQGRYRQQKDIAERRIGGFWSAGGDGHAHEAGGARRGFSLDHSELMLAANIDPFWRGQAMLAVQDDKVEVEEAWFQSIGLPHGLKLKGGRLRSGIGYLNGQHAHQWDFADAPLAYTALFGAHGSYTQDGVQLKWLAPTPFFLEFGAEAGRGANFPGTDRNRNGIGGGALFAHVGGDLGRSQSWQAGLSWLGNRAEGRTGHFETIDGGEAEGLFSGRSRTWLADFVWKWAPDGNPKVRNLKIQGEWFVRRETGTIDCQDEAGVGNACAGGSLSDYATRQRGAYLQAVWQFAPDWRLGARYDWLDSGRRDFGSNAERLAVESYRPRRGTLMADYRWSEFSRLRLQLADDRAHPGITDRQLTVQYIMSLGAHAAHSF